MCVSNIAQRHIGRFQREMASRPHFKDHMEYSLKRDPLEYGYGHRTKHKKNNKYKLRYTFEDDANDCSIDRKREVREHSTYKMNRNLQSIMSRIQNEHASFLTVPCALTDTVLTVR